MHVKINKYSLIGMFANLVAILICISISSYSEKRWITFSFWFYLATLIINVSLIYKIKKSFLNIPLVYYALSFLFNLSQIYLGYIGLNDYYCIFTRISFQFCQQTFTFAFVCIHIAMTTYYCTHKKERDFKFYEFSTSNLDRTILKIYFYIFFAIKLIIRSYWFYISKTLGYNALLEELSSIPSLLVMMADIITIMYLRYCCDYKRRISTFGVVAILEFVYMLSGSRINGITFLLVVFLTVSFNNSRRLSLQKKAMILLIIVLIMLFLPSISANRLYSNRSIFSLKYLANSNIFVSIIKEFGMTILNTAVEMENISRINFLNGQSYYAAVATLIPNINGRLDEINNALFYTNQLRPLFYYAYGGSNVAEAFINFKWIGVFVFIPVGYLFATLDNSMQKIFTYKIAGQVFFIALLYEAILWIRGYFFTMLRLPIWLSLMYLITYKLLKRKYKQF